MSPQGRRIPPPPPGTYEVAGGLVDLAIEFIGESVKQPTADRARSVRKSGQQLRLAATLVVNGTWSLDLGRAWIDAARITLTLLRQGVLV